MDASDDSDAAAVVRLGELRAELERGRQRHAELEQERGELASTLLRIEGAILVLEELTASAGPMSLAQRA